MDQLILWLEGRPVPAKATVFPQADLSPHTVGVNLYDEAGGLRAWVDLTYDAAESLIAGLQASVADGRAFDAEVERMFAEKT